MALLITKAAPLLLLLALSATEAQVRFPGRGGGGGRGSNGQPFRPRPAFPPSTPVEQGYPAGFPGGPGSDTREPGATVACTDFNGLPGQCVPAVNCPEFYDALLTRSGGVCALQDGTAGVCCPAVKPTAQSSGEVFHEAQREVEIRSFAQQEVRSAQAYGSGAMQSMLEIEKRLKSNGDYIKKGTPAASHQNFVRVNAVSLDLGRKAFASIEAAKDLAKKNNLNPDEAGFGLRKLNMRGSEFCTRPPACPRIASRFRTIDGSCNNPQEPDWGQSNTGLQRLLPPTYNDGIFEPRSLSVTGQPLPSARLVSATAILDADKPDRQFTALVTQYGQFLDHDLTHIGVFRIDENTGIQCCRDGQFIEPSPHPACLPIEIPADDRFYARFGQRCMEFVRALPAPRRGCALGFADQINVNTHYLDSSTIYGQTDEQARALRAFRNGQLSVQAVASPRPSLPLAEREGDECTNITLGIRCFRAGDDRVNEQPGLTLVHIVWVREHNRVAAELQTLHPNWDDERLYQEARKITSAEMSHITYNEWLPIILGPTYMTNFRLFPQRVGYSEDYDPTVNPSVTNEFASAAFRFGHTLLQAQYPLFETTSSRPNQVLLLRNLFNSVQIYNSPRAVEALARGLSLQPMQTFDSCITEEVTNQLFRTNNPFGLDLVSLNTQRARDVGLPTYNQMRELCGLGRAQRFEDLLNDMPAESVRRFQSIYASPDDIDLFVGGVSENSVPDAVLGPTFLCIIGDQYTRLKRGDRFFYEFNLGPQAFTEAQLNEIRKTSFARILCDNTDVGEMQPLAFIRPGSAINNKRSCNSPDLPRVSFAPWRRN